MAGVRRQPGVGTEAGGLPPSLCLEALPPGTVGLDKDTPLIAARWLLPHSALDAGHTVVCAGAGTPKAIPYCFRRCGTLTPWGVRPLVLQTVFCQGAVCTSSLAASPGPQGKPCMS